MLIHGKSPIGRQTVFTYNLLQQSESQREKQCGNLKLQTLTSPPHSPSQNKSVLIKFLHK